MKAKKGTDFDKTIKILLICIIAAVILLVSAGVGLIVAQGGFSGNNSSYTGKPNGHIIGGESSVISNTDQQINNLSSNVSSSENSSSLDENPNETGNKSYTPSTVTLTLYGSSGYGVTWQTVGEPKNSVVQISKGNSFNKNNYKEFKATVTKEQSYNALGSSYNYYVSKAVITGLQTGTTYTYRCYDKTTKTEGDVFSFKTRSNSSSFKFVHLSDTQTAASNAQSPDGSGTGDFVANNTMVGIAQNAFNPEFMLHTGDIVEWSKYESYWNAMINTNKNYFAGLPVMTLSGNHETTYRNGMSEINKHFNYDIPSQFRDDVSKGFSYYFDYGNTRFIMLDTNNLTNNKLPTAEYNWLVSTLNNNNKKWTIVSIHNPMYSVGAYGSDPNKNAAALGLRAQLGDLFAQKGVDLVLQGHDHTYSNTYPIGVGGTIQTDYESETINGVTYRKNPNGVIYAMHGPSGNQQRSEYSNVESKYYEYHSGSRMASWAEIEVTDSLLTVKVYYYDAGQAKLRFSYGIKK